MDEVHRQRPPLIGNRRQGLDLLQIGGRQWPLLLKIHFFNPAKVSGASIMPSYVSCFVMGAVTARLRILKACEVQEPHNTLPTNESGASPRLR
jgi:cbb3-type cytochrome oxidase cytochrome c subunit